MIDPATAYAIQGEGAPNIFLEPRMYLPGLLVFYPEAPDQAGRWLPMPVADDVYALFYASGPSAGGDARGLALTMTIDNGRMAAQVTPFQGALSQQFRIVNNTLNFGMITALEYPGGPMAVYNVQGTDWWALGTWPDPTFVLLPPPGWGALVPDSDVVTLQQPTPCGIYPELSGAGGQPLPALPIPTSIDSPVPERVPADPAQDPLVGEMRIPFYLVAGDLSIDQQVANNPWYVMRHYQYWYLLPHAYRRYGGAAEDQELDWEVGTETDSSASLSDTMGITVQADGGFKLGGLSAGLSEKFTQELGIALSTTEKVLTTEKISQTFHFVDGEAAIVANYVVGHRYELSRADGTLIRTWDVIANDMLTGANYSSLHPGGPKQLSGDQAR